MTRKTERDIRRDVEDLRADLQTAPDRAWAVEWRDAQPDAHPEGNAHRQYARDESVVTRYAGQMFADAPSGL